MNKKQTEMLEKIGEFFLKLKGGDYKETEKFLRMMEVTKLEVLSKTKILILLRRPGILIGRRGETITALSEHLKMEIQIVEDTQPSVYDFLIPRDYSDF